jgi:hypothetical protein
MLLALVWLFRPIARIGCCELPQPTILAKLTKAIRKGRLSRFGLHFAGIGCCVPPQPNHPIKARMPKGRRAFWRPDGPATSRQAHNPKGQPPQRTDPQNRPVERSETRTVQILPTKPNQIKYPSPKGPRALPKIPQLRAGSPLSSRSSRSGRGHTLMPGSIPVVGSLLRVDTQQKAVEVVVANRFCCSPRRKFAKSPSRQAAASW